MSFQDTDNFGGEIRPIYSIGSEIIGKYEKELLDSLAELYPDADEREIVEQILLPQFRSQLQKVLDEFNANNKREPGQPLKPVEVPKLCEAVSEMIKENRTLLNVDGVFGPALKWIQQSRVEVAEEIDEEFKGQCRDLFAEHGITDRFSLFEIGPSIFIQTDFPPFGKFRSFAKAILGETIANPSRGHLSCIADLLFGIAEKEKARQLYKDVLSSHGITDRQSLIHFGVTKFMNTEFPPFGMGRAFAKAILGKQTNPVKSSHLHQISDVLDFPKFEEGDQKRKYIECLAAHNVTCRRSLIHFGVSQFRDAYYPPYGKGAAFAKAILGKNSIPIKLAHLHEIADKLDLLELSEETKNNFRDVLSRNGITDIGSLRIFGTAQFITTHFKPYGKGTHFAGVVLGKKVPSVNSSRIEMIGKVLDLPELSAENNIKCVEALANKGITDKKSLMHFGAVRFAITDFDPIGNGKTVARLIFGKVFKELKLFDLEKIAEVLQLEEFSEETKKQFREALALHDIVDRDSLLQFGILKLRSTDFQPYGRGHSLVNLILNESFRGINRGHLDRVSDILFPEETNPTNE